MQRVNFFLDLRSIVFLRKLPGTLSEHLRKAVREYIDKFRVNNASGSASTRKERDTE